MTRTTVWHNPRCSKSRAVVERLASRGVDVMLYLYLGDPPDAVRLRGVLAAAGLAPSALLRRGEDRAAALATAGEDAVLHAMAADPRLIERPIVETAKGTRLCRPAERVDAIL